MKIIIDLHAAPGSQNGYEHSSSRDSSQEWGNTEENIQQTVDVIDFLTARFILILHASFLGRLNCICIQDNQTHIYVWQVWKECKLVCS